MRPDNTLFSPIKALETGYEMPYRDHVYFYKNRPPCCPLGIEAFKKSGDEKPIGRITFSEDFDAETPVCINTIWVDEDYERRGIGTVLKTLTKETLLENGVNQVLGNMRIYEPKVKDNNFVLGPISPYGVATFLSAIKTPVLTKDGKMSTQCFAAKINAVVLGYFFSIEDDCGYYYLEIEVLSDLRSQVARKNVKLGTKKALKKFSQGLVLPTVSGFDERAILHERPGFLRKTMGIPFP
jgi:GNAT superfamily N-acetyltransferase